MSSENISYGSEISLKRTESTLSIRTKCEKYDAYNPYEHRHIAHPTSTIGSFFNLLKSSLGSGLLAMPAAFKHAGLIPGCVGTVAVALVASYCVHILVRTSTDLCRIHRTASLNYAETCELAFKYGPKKLRRYSTLVRHFVDYAMAGVCLGGTSVYVIFVASSLKDIFDHLYPGTRYPVEAYCGFLLLPLILITQLRHLKFLVPFSLFANICLLGTFCITCYYTFTDIPAVTEDMLVADVVGWPLFLSTAIFAMEGINVVMPIENEMAHPEQFPTVLNCTMAFVALLYGIVGALGYIKYGETALGSVTLNLPQGEPLALTAKVLVALAVFFTYCLQMYAPMDIMWARVQEKVSLRYHNWGQIIMRTLSVVFTVTLAVAVPDLELLIGVVGAVFFSTLGLFIPVITEAVHLWGTPGSNWVIGRAGALVCVYLLVLFSGCYASGRQIAIRFR